MNVKMATNSQPSASEPKKQKQKLSKQLEQEQKYRNGDHMKVIIRKEEVGEWRKEYRE